MVSSYVKEVRLELRSTEAFVMRLLEDMIQVIQVADAPREENKTDRPPCSLRPVVLLISVHCWSDVTQCVRTGSNLVSNASAQEIAGLWETRSFRSARLEPALLSVIRGKGRSPGDQC